MLRYLSPPALGAAAGRTLHRPIVSISGGGAGGSAVSEHSPKLVLYSKDGCCLCSDLKEKLVADLPDGKAGILRHVNLEIRNISLDPEWERRYQYEIPVLARVLADGTEEILPRLSPRLGAKRIQEKIASAMGL